MRLRLAVLLVWTLTPPTYGGEESSPAAPVAAPATRPPTLAQAADAVLAALAAKDEAALGALAARDEPDPWFVADELVRRGEHDAAEAFAKAAPRPDTESLPAYVASQRGVADDPARRKRLAASGRARRAQDHPGVLDALGPPETPPLQDVLGIWLAARRGEALLALSRPEEAAAARAAEAEGAERLGWLARAASAHFDRAAQALQREDPGTALAALERALAIQQRRGSAAGVLQVQHRIADALWRRGDLPQALAAYERVLPMAEALGDKRRAALVQGIIGSLSMLLGSYDRALEALEQSRATLEALGDRETALAALNDLGTLHMARGENARALEVFQQVLAAREADGNRLGIAAALGGVGSAKMGLGDHEGARADLERALSEMEALGERRLAAVVMGNLAEVYSMGGERARALALTERTLAEKEAVSDRLGAAITLRGIGSHHETLGDFPRALAAYERSREALLAVGNPIEAAVSLAAIGNIHFLLGDYGKALSTYERARADVEPLGAQDATAKLELSLGNVYHSLGDPTKALAHHKRAYRLLESTGDRWGANAALANIGADYFELGDDRQALACFERAYASAEALGDRSGAAVMLGNIGSAQHRLGDFAQALATHERAVALLEELGDRRGLAGALKNLGNAQHRLGDLKGARASIERSVRTAKSLRAVPVLVGSLQALGEVHLAAGAPGRALAAAREGLAQVERLLGGLAEEEGAQARGVHQTLFGVGAVAAAREEDPAALLEFLESGRAGALLDALGKRDLLRWKAEALPEELRAADLRASAAHTRAREVYDRAQGSGTRDRKALAAAREALEAAEEELRAVNVRISREAKRGAEIFYPRAKTIEEVQAALEEGEALVLYGLCLDEALALVVRPEEERIVALGKSAPVEDACRALDLGSPDGEAGPALTSLAELLVKPLGLGPEVSRVLLSPDGPLGYLPFGAIFEIPVVLTPSGTTHVLLREEERDPGVGILALGDPDYAGSSEGAQALYYRGRALQPLPATRAEVEAVGTTTLLGAAATEDGLRRALAEQKRWRAVHLACHGLVDPERPGLSALALTRGGDQDGFLTAMEVLQHRIPADLAVLSACETAKGRLMQAEGIIGLTRAFMYAGTPRVICSLWKVDDEATSALMQRFYALWNPKGDTPGLGAAEALREAQTHVRSQERWSHPYFWAAWVLWGLP